MALSVLIRTIIVVIVLLVQDLVVVALLAEPEGHQGSEAEEEGHHEDDDIDLEPEPALWLSRHAGLAILAKDYHHGINPGADSEKGVENQWVVEVH